MPRIGVVIVAYNAASTLSRVLDRIPPDFRSEIDGIYIGDNNSEDGTYLVGLGYQQAQTDLPIHVVRHPRNLGYGGNQKAGYRWAIEQGFDIVVMLHADGQYAPEFLPDIVKPLVEGECDAVFGSRMMRRGDARRGGMPLYKYLGNGILTRIQNALSGLRLTEWHSGYRAYSVPALTDVPFERATDEFHFDTQIILQLREAKKRIVELPIPTYYGDEICYVAGMKYARECLTDVVRYRAHKMGFGSGEMAFATPTDAFESTDERSHVRVLSWLAGRAPSRILDLGCGDGLLAQRARELGHHVVGVDRHKRDGIGARTDQFIEADLDRGIPDEIGDDFDVVLAIDVVGYVRDPGKLLLDATGRLRRGGSLIVSVPNFGHWYPRARVALGIFGYDRRGILDQGHLRFFTRTSAKQLFDDRGLSVRRDEVIGLPLDTLVRRAPEDAAPPRVPSWLRRLDRASVAMRPSLFGYQFLYEVERSDTE
jgi:SAM-dependent methyltransferase